jgi:hypothetical protein
MHELLAIFVSMIDSYHCIIFITLIKLFLYLLHQLIMIHLNLFIDVDF